MARPAVRRAGLAAVGLLAVAVAVFAVLAPPERCPSYSAGELRDAAAETVGWFARNQHDDGRWTYLYDADAREAPDDYNIVRHAGVMMSLYQAAAAEVPGAQESADRGLVWAQDRLVSRRGWTAVRDGGDGSVGATALLVAGLAERRLLTDDDTYDELLQGAGQFLVDQTEPSGAVLARYSIRDGAPQAGVYSKYYTGEAYWALGRLHGIFPDGPWGETADRIGAYLATRRDTAEDQWPPLPDHWSAYGLSEIRDRPLTDDELAYARRQAGLFGAQVRWLSQAAGPWGLLVRGPAELRGGGYGVTGEALTRLWQLAQSEPGLAALRQPLAERARCVAGLAADAQSTDGPGEVRGAWFSGGETRMDDQQHAMSALLGTIPIADADERGGTDRPAPSVWLWLVALLAAFNPFRIARALPPDDRTRIAALGGLAGSAVVLGLALASDALLDVLDVSAPALRVAAGIVAAVTAVVGMVRRGPDADAPALPGLRAALVPVAVPLVVGPALVVLGLSASADRGLAPVALALAVGVAALTALAATGPPDAVLSWANRAASAVLLATSTLLVINGIFDV